MHIEITSINRFTANSNSLMARALTVEVEKLEAAGLIILDFSVHYNPEGARVIWKLGDKNAE